MNRSVSQKPSDGSELISLLTSSTSTKNESAEDHAGNDRQGAGDEATNGHALSVVVHLLGLVETQEAEDHRTDPQQSTSTARPECEQAEYPEHEGCDREAIALGLGRLRPIGRGCRLEATRLRRGHSGL